MPRQRRGERYYDYVTRITGIPADHAYFGNAIARVQNAQETEARLIARGVIESQDALPDATLNNLRPLEPINVLSPTRVVEAIEHLRQRSDEQEAPTKPERPRVSSQDLATLDLAASKILDEIHLRKNKQYSPRKEKESSYLSAARQRAWNAKTVTEIVQSDTPIVVSSVSSKILRQITDAGICNIDQGNATIECRKCSRYVSYSYAFFCASGAWCAIHVPRVEHCALCNYKTDDCTPVKAYDNTVSMLCKRCRQERNRCRNCSSVIGPEYIGIQRCKVCVDVRSGRSGTIRPFSRTMKWVGGRGKIVQSSRVFSAEMEAMTPSKNWSTILSQVLPKEMGIDQDGSVGVRGRSPYGFEIQTPRLGGSKGEELVTRVCAAVRQLNPVIDTTCGMHIHLDGAGVLPVSRHESPEALVKLWKTYLVFEDVFLSLLPFSRRGNDYSRSLSDAFQLTELDTIETLLDAEKIWYRESDPNQIQEAKNHHYHSSRYFGPNFNPLFAHGHFEVRFHSGTLNARKILEWANLHALVLDACAGGKIKHELLREARNTTKLSEKTQMLFSAIGLSKSSVAYYQGRQNKFSSKKNGDEEVKEAKKTISLSPRWTLSQGFRPLTIEHRSLNGTDHLVSREIDTMFINEVSSAIDAAEEELTNEN